MIDKVSANCLACHGGGEMQNGQAVFKISKLLANTRDGAAGSAFVSGRMKMFGNPEWFRPKTIGLGLVPRSWQGWAYSAAWGSTISLPFLLLVGRHQSLEALLWLALSFGAMTYDVWQILTSIGHSKKPTQLTCRETG